jgi:hypothetical protein
MQEDHVNRETGPNIIQLAVGDPDNASFRVKEFAHCTMSDELLL